MVVELGGGGGGGGVVSSVVGPHKILLEGVLP